MVFTMASLHKAKTHRIEGYTCIGAMYPIPQILDRFSKDLYSKQSHVNENE